MLFSWFLNPDLLVSASSRRGTCLGRSLSLRTGPRRLLLSVRIGSRLVVVNGLGLPARCFWIRCRNSRLDLVAGVVCPSSRLRSRRRLERLAFRPGMKYLLRGPVIEVPGLERGSGFAGAFLERLVPAALFGGRVYGQEEAEKAESDRPGCQHSGRRLCFPRMRVLLSRVQPPRFPCLEFGL